eukprot:857274-Prymnesium_polylepis.1
MTTVWRTADGLMCLGSHRATITAREARSENPRRGPGCASDVESASDRAWSREVYHVYALRVMWAGRRRARSSGRARGYANSCYP